MTEFLGFRVSDPYPIPPGIGRVHYIKGGLDATDEEITNLCACCGGSFEPSEMHRVSAGHIGSRCLHCASVQSARQKRMRAIKKGAK